MRQGSRWRPVIRMLPSHGSDCAAIQPSRSALTQALVSIGSPRGRGQAGSAARHGSWDWHVAVSTGRLARADVVYSSPLASSVHGWPFLLVERHDRASPGLWFVALDAAFSHRPHRSVYVERGLRVEPNRKRRRLRRIVPGSAERDLSLGRPPLSCHVLSPFALFFLSEFFRSCETARRLRPIPKAVVSGSWKNPVASLHYGAP